MSKLTHKEPTAEQIAEEKLYREIGLTDEEYKSVVNILGRSPTGRKQGSTA